MTGKVKDRVGLRFGKLLVISFDSVKGENSLWLCRCDCGIEKIINSKYLSKKKSCGCYQESHGFARHPVYKVWASMLQRCTNQKDKYFENYGGRGISVSREWESFSNFIHDMGIPEKGMTLDRIDNDKGYSKENCRWATRNEQMRNNRKNINITFNGETKCVKDWATSLGFSSGQSITRRLKNGWTIEEALTKNGNT